MDDEKRTVAVIGGYSPVPWGRANHLGRITNEGSKAFVFAFDGASSSQLHRGGPSGTYGLPVQYNAAMCFYFGPSRAKSDLSLDCETLRIQFSASEYAFEPVIYEAVGARGIKWTDFEYQVLMLSKDKKAAEAPLPSNHDSLIMLGRAPLSKATTSIGTQVAPLASPPAPAPAPVPAPAPTQPVPPLDGPFDGPDSEPIKFLDYLAGLSDSLPDGITRANILLVGPVGSGKSSIVSTLDSAIKGRISHLAPYGTSGPYAGFFTAVTQQMAKYKFDVKVGGEWRPLPVSLWDTAGWPTSKISYEGDGLEQILDGRLPSGFDLSRNPYEAQPGFKAGPEPGLSEQVHAMAFVLSVTDIQNMASQQKGELRCLIAVARSRGIPSFIFLTKIDLFEPKVLSREPGCRPGAMASLDTVLRLPYIVGKIKEAAAAAGLPSNLVFPLKSYESELSPAREPAILLLRALPYVLNAVADAQERRAILKDAELEAAAEPDGGAGSCPGPVNGASLVDAQQAAPSSGSGSALGSAEAAEASAEPAAAGQQAFVGILDQSEAAQPLPVPVLPTASGLEVPVLGPGGVAGDSGSGGAGLPNTDPEVLALASEPGARDSRNLFVPSPFEGGEEESVGESDEDYSLVGLVG